MPFTKPSMPDKPVKLRIKKGDTVCVITGKDKGRRGLVLSASPKTNQITVEDINVAVRHRKERPSKVVDSSGQPSIVPGGKISSNAPMHIAKVMLVCPHCDRPTRVGYAYRDGEEKLSRRKYRVCKHSECGKSLDSIDA